MNKFIGDSQFYRRVLLITVPIMIQSGITNLVSFLDNIMVGRVGTEQMSGVAIVNQLIFIFYLCLFGGFAGAGIFTAQFYGKGDNEGIRYTIRYKLILGAVILAVTTAILVLKSDTLIGMFLQGESGSGDAVATFNYAKDYLSVMMWELPAFALTQICFNTLRECSETVVPMKAGLVAVFLNLCLNYLLIYGNFGFPVLGVRGAAIATVIARYVELLIAVIWALTHLDRCPYLIGLFGSFKLPAELFKKIFLTGTPLLINEFLWSSGVAVMAQSYSLRGLSVVAAYNILGVINNVFNVVFFAMGDAVAIIVGQHLGAGNLKKAREEDTKIIAFSVMIATVVAIIVWSAAPLFPKLYNTNDEVKRLATEFLKMQALFLPQMAFLHTTYFTLRSGGKTLITFLFDSFFMWTVNVPLVYCLSRFTDIYVIHIFMFIQMAEWIKCLIGFILVKKGTWMNNIVNEKS